LKRLQHGQIRPEAQKSRSDGPFGKLGKVLLASAMLVVSCHEPEPQKAESKPQIVGRYECLPQKRVGGQHIFAVELPMAYSFNLTEKDGTLFKTDALGMPHPLTRDSAGFSYEGGTRQRKIIGVGRFSEDGGLILRETYKLSGVTAVYEWKCKHCADAASKVMKAVFIRPGSAEYQFYNSFGGLGKNAATVGGGTLQSTARDLLNSGVTDIFIGFKTDFPWSATGHSGDLLFDSREGGYEDPISLSARQNGFNPISAFMNACQAAYAAAGKKVRFHAWFPVFKDEYAVRFGFQTGNANSGFVGNVLDAASHFLTGKNCDCQSNVAAEPSNPMVATYELTTLKELMAEYPLLSGINLDYIRYSLASDPCYEGGNVKKDV